MAMDETAKYNVRKKIFRSMFWGGWIVSGIPLSIAIIIWGQEASEAVKNIILGTLCLGIAISITSMFIALNWDLQTLQLSIQKKEK